MRCHHYMIKTRNITIAVFGISTVVITPDLLYTFIGLNFVFEVLGEVFDIFFTSANNGSPLRAVA